MLLAEEFLLLAHDHHTGAPVRGSAVWIESAIGAAILEEAWQDGRIRCDGRDWMAYLRAVDDTPTGHPAVDEWIRLAKRHVGGRLSDCVASADLVSSAYLLDGMVAAGLMERREEKVLGLFTRHRWYAVDRERSGEVRARLRDVLAEGATPDRRTTALIALACSIRGGLAQALPDPSDDALRRAAELSKDHWITGVMRHTRRDLWSRLLGIGRPLRLPRRLVSGSR